MVLLIGPATQPQELSSTDVAVLLLQGHRSGELGELGPSTAPVDNSLCSYHVLHRFVCVDCQTSRSPMPAGLLTSYGHLRKRLILMSRWCSD